MCVCVRRYAFFWCTCTLIKSAFIPIIRVAELPTIFLKSFLGDSSRMEGFDPKDLGMRGRTMTIRLQWQHMIEHVEIVNMWFQNETPVSRITSWNCVLGTTWARHPALIPEITLWRDQVLHQSGV